MIGRVNTGGGGTDGTLTVTAPANVTVTVSKDGKTKTKNSGTSGVAVFKGLASGTWTVTITSDGKTAQKNVIITTDYSTAISFNTIPEFTYTGDYEIVNDSDEPITVSQGNWKIRFLTSGTLTFTNLNGAEGGIDVFLVGGGGDGGKGQSNSDTGGYWSGAGGGSGFTTTESVIIKAGVDYSISVPSAGGDAQAFGKTALHGNNGTSDSGGNGGSGGGKAGVGGEGKGGTGGVDGSDGGGPGGTGQGTTTREFGESAGKLYATGGDGASGYSKAPANQVPNSGNGGGGGGFNTKGSAGSSGIVIARNARRAA